MLISALAQLRHTASVVFGLPFSLWALDQLVKVAQETQQEFGCVVMDAETLQEPPLGGKELGALSLRRFRSQAERAARTTRYYSRLFSELGIDSARLNAVDIAQVPLTRKEDLRADPDAFVNGAAGPAFRTTTTGTTGAPAPVCFSAHEMHVYIALNTIGALLQGEISPEDMVQISTSARATLGNTCFALACERIGALWYQTGIVGPELLLATLAERRRIAGKKPQVSWLNTYASVLGEIVEYGLCAGYRPTDFGLERISVGGEIVTVGLKRRCQQLFGEVQFIEGYAMTETWPFFGSRCEQGHLHYEPSQGLLEVIDPETGGTAQPGHVGTVVVTPFAPYRETTLLLRYKTEDLVRALDEPLTCNRRHLPATTDLLGKRRLAVCHDGQWVTPRDVLEALEGLEEVPLPARCGFWPVPGGVEVEVVVRADTAHTRQAVLRALEEHRIPVQVLHMVPASNLLQRPFPHRCDLRELTFHPHEPEPVRAPAQRELAAP